jgi:hypothetical protein
VTLARTIAEDEFAPHRVMPRDLVRWSVGTSVAPIAAQAAADHA